MFQFKGSRNYLHGTDFYQQTQARLDQQFSDISHISLLTFRRFARNQCQLTLEEPASQNNIPCQGTALKKDSSPIKFWWVETAEPVTGSYPYDEDKLVEPAKINADLDTIALTRPAGNYHTIEVVVALTKKLHYAKSADINGKWVFGQLNLTRRLPIQYQTAEISIQSFFPGRFSVSAIKLDNELMGSIRFIVGQP